MPKINLLPLDLVPKSLTVKAVKVLKTVVLFGALAFISTSAVLIALVVVDTLKLTNLVKNRDQLLTEINANQKTEQSLFLIRDRLDKIKVLEGQKSGGVIVNDIVQILPSLPASVGIDSANITTNESEIVFSTGSSLGVTQTMATMLAGNYFSTLNLNSFTYNSQKGYLVGFGISK